MGKKILNVKGTKDILFNEAKKFREIEKIFLDISEKYNYTEIITPCLEFTELFSRGIGEFTDIVEKEMFTFSDSKGKKISLRPENTAGVVRSYIQNSFFNDPGIKKFFYIGPMFRHERPQAGRQRQFFQLGCEVFGSDSPMLDAEVIEYALKFIYETGINKELIELQISSVGCPECRADYNKILVDFLRKNSENLCESCKIRMEKNPLRVLDCKEKNCQLTIENAPKMIDNLCDECNNNFVGLTNFLKINDIDFIVNKRLVRGLDYYTKTVFEITIKEGLGSQNTILAGGRYNNLVKELGGPNVPAVGWAAGMERLLLSLKIDEVQTFQQKKFFIIYDNNTKNNAYKLLKNLRNNNLKADLEFSGKSFKAQFKLANKLNYRFILICGENEINSNRIKFKDFQEHSEKDIEQNKLIEFLKNINSEVE